MVSDQSYFKIYGRLFLQRIMIGFFVLAAIGLIMPGCARSQSVNLMWDANTDPDIAGYKVYYGTGSRTYATNVNVGAFTSCTISGLTPNSTYYFAATAYNTGGLESGYSNEIAYAVSTSTTATVPTSTTATVPTSTTTVPTSTTTTVPTSTTATVPTSTTATVPTSTTTTVPTSTTTVATIPTSTAATVAFAVNAGGPQYTEAVSGITYRADGQYSGGWTSTASVAITGTADPTVYKSRRYNPSYYNIPLANGSYNLTLKFAEVYWTKAGSRVFNVYVGSQKVISSLDVLARAGSNRALDITVPVTVTNGHLYIRFGRVKDYPMVSAIVVKK